MMRSGAWGETRELASTGLLFALAALVAGSAAALLPAKLVLVLVLAPCLIVLVVTFLGPAGICGLLVMAVGLFPTTINQEQGALLIGGIPATTLRLALTVLLTGLAILLLGDKFLAKTTVRERRFLASLGALVLFGIGAAAFAGYPDPSGTIDSIAHTAGQPLAYGLIFAVFISVLRSASTARVRLLVAWVASVLIEGLYAIYQVKTGHAYDPIYHDTRAFGTMGPDFLGAYMLMGIFAAASLWTSRTKRWHRWLSACAVAVAVPTIILAIVRTSLVAFVIGGAVFLFTGKGGRARVIIAALGVGVLLFVFQGYWAARFNSAGTQSFDRPATWVEATRMAEDHPWTGVGGTDAQIELALKNNLRYRINQFGVTVSVPHNAWLIALAGGGVIYGLMFVMVTWRFGRMIPRPRGSIPDRYLLAGLVAGGVSYFVNTMFNHPEITTVMLLNAALLVTRQSNSTVAPPAAGAIAFGRPADTTSRQLVSSSAP